MIKCLGPEEDNLPLEHTAQHFEYHFTASVLNLNLNSKTEITKLFPQVAEDQIFFLDTDSSNSEEVWDINNERNEEQNPSSGPVNNRSTDQLTAPGSPGESFCQNFDSAGSSVPQIQSLQNCSQIWIISSDET